LWRPLPGWRAHGGRRRDCAPLRVADCRPSGSGRAEGRQNASAGIPAVPRGRAASVQGGADRGRGSRSDLSRRLRGAGAAAGGRGPGLEPPACRAGGRGAHTVVHRQWHRLRTVTDPSSDFHCGFAALVGRPNVGKSTLLNALVGQKLSIVTPRPQTTRHRIIGLAQLPKAQIAFVDTPGLHSQARRTLNKAMNRTAAAALEDADLVVLVVEALVWNTADGFVLDRLKQSGRPAIAVVNKVDGVHPKERLLPYLAEMSARYEFLEVVPVSAL